MASGWLSRAANLAQQASERAKEAAEKAAKEAVKLQKEASAAVPWPLARVACGGRGERLRAGGGAVLRGGAGGEGLRVSGGERSFE